MYEGKKVRIAILGKTGYVSSCFQRYIRLFNSYEVKTFTVRNGEWDKINYSQFDVVFCAIGLAHDSARKGTDEEFYRLNCELPHKIASLVKSTGCPLFIHMSSMISYVDNNTTTGTYITKKSKPNPSGIYGKSKLAGDNALLNLTDSQFKVAIIRSPIVFGEYAVDNFEKLVKIAERTPVFPNYNNRRSMIYSDNLCELIRLIIDHQSDGIFFPQEKEYLSTSKLVKDISKEFEKKIWMPVLANKIIKILLPYSRLLQKVFGDCIYSMDMSNHFEGKYRVCSYEEAIVRIVNRRKYDEKNMSS